MERQLRTRRQQWAVCNAQLLLPLWLLLLLFATPAAVIGHLRSKTQKHQLRHTGMPCACGVRGSHNSPAPVLVSACMPHLCQGV
jgi:hypothetical protein